MREPKKNKWNCIKKMAIALVALGMFLSVEARIAGQETLVTVEAAEDEDFEIVDGDIMSIRKHGKYRISSDGAKSRKDRYFITYYKY